MLAPHHRLTRRSDFTRTLKFGVRANRRHFVAYVDRPEYAPGQVLVGGPRFGLIVGKSVGNAVTRHAVSRKLRAAAAGNTSIDPQTMVVLRALPAAAQASSTILAAELAGVLSRDPVDRASR
ncbi:ribonuclease P protein component [Jongsikchunia kroppenstedtii]|uniref:ribonuclease P protein component n=1 Tax=Jongsikchunia kroppenstedtii TaxID=1121721 RepID=UPI00036ED4E5